MFCSPDVSRLGTTWISSTSPLSHQFLLRFPRPSLPQPTHQVHQPNQNGHLDKRANRRRERLVTIGTKGGHSDSNRQLKVVACSGKALRHGKGIHESKPACDDESDEEDADKVHDERRRDAYDGNDLVHDLATLGGEEDENSVEQADEGPGGRELEEDAFVPVRASCRA